MGAGREFENLFLHALECVFIGDLYNEAAEAAMEAMKGRLANKYFALAEEAYGEMEEEGEETTG
mgnify:CR=1 FL=1